MDYIFLIQIILLRLTLLLIIITVYFIIRNKHIIIKKSFENSTYIFLSLIFIFSIYLRLFYSPLNYFHENSHGYEYVNDSITLPGFHFFGGSYYIFYNFFYLFLPKNETTIFIINVFIGSLSVLLVFLISYQLFNNEIIALYAALLTCAFPLYIRLSSSESFFTLGLFFVLLTLNCFIFYIKTDNLLVLFLSILFLNYTMQIRPYFMLLPFPILVGFLVLDKKLFNKLRNYKVWLIFLFLLLLLLTHIIFHINNILTNDQIKTYDLSLKTYLFYIISPNYNIILNYKYFPSLILLFSIFGLLFLIHKKQKKSLLFLLFFLVFYMYIYINISENIPTMLRKQSIYQFILLIIGGCGIYFLINLFKNNMIRFILHIASLFLIITTPFFYYHFITSLYNPQIEFNYIKDNIKYLPDNGILIYNDHSENREIISHFPYWLLEENNKKIEAIRLSKFLEDENDYFENNIILFYQGITFFSFGRSEYGLIESKKINSTVVKFEQKKLSYIHNRYNKQTISELKFDNKPYGSEIVPQKEIIIGFYYLSKK